MSQSEVMPLKINFFGLLMREQPRMNFKICVDHFKEFTKIKTGLPLFVLL